MLMAEILHCKRSHPKLHAQYSQEGVPANSCKCVDPLARSLYAEAADSEHSSKRACEQPKSISCCLQRKNKKD